MSNILSFPSRPRAAQTLPLAGLAEAVRQGRHAQSNVLWLKENAELLGMMAACGLSLPDTALAAYEETYNSIPEQMKLYPQYYRFWLSICLDLEDLGLGGPLGADLCGWADDAGLADAELSDLQRAEARRLLTRRGVGQDVRDGALGDRLRHFTNRSGTFALPNKKAAYELTHIVFYLSDYGRQDPGLDGGTLTSLEYAGVLAFLDQDMDLLAEVCTALRYAGLTPSPVWTEAIAAAHRGMYLHSQPGAPLNDGFHAYLVTGWALQTEGQKGFTAPVPTGPLRIDADGPRLGALRPMSAWLGETAQRPRKRGDWGAVRADILNRLCDTRRAVLERAERSIPAFAAFFERFARV